MANSPANRKVLSTLLSSRATQVRGTIEGFDAGIFTAVRCAKTGRDAWQKTDDEGTLDAFLALDATGRIAGGLISLGPTEFSASWEICQPISEHVDILALAGDGHGVRSEYQWTIVEPVAA